MKICGIYNAFDSIELLKGSMECLKNDVDLFIIIYQTESNYGEKYNPLDDFDFTKYTNTICHLYTPIRERGGAWNETRKRNIGLDIAREHGCTHFLHLDCDEYYQNFAEAKQKFIDSKAKGSVCKILTYFKKPTLRLESPDNYYVPFIHKLYTNTNSGYQNQIIFPFYADPTRLINEENVVLLDVFMHHFSWIRNDIERKVRNSSAKSNIERSNLLEDYYSEETKAGTFLVDYNQKLIEVENIFNFNF